MLRPMIHIDEEKCDGCGQCVIDCAEGALAIVNGKARLISETYCDGLGACLNCPKGALSLQTREAPAFDEEAALKAKAERDNSDISNQSKSSPVRHFVPLARLNQNKDQSLQSSLPVWPLKLGLANPKSSWLKGAKILLASDCSGFALQNIQEEMKNHVPLIACPKLGNREKLTSRLAEIMSEAQPASIKILRMSVPCCGGLETVANDAKELAKSDVPIETVIVQI